jgi:ribosome-associated protein
MKPPDAQDQANNDVVDRAVALASESFIAASGPGGQNVNKLATAVQLRLDIYALRLPPEIFGRLKDLAGSRMTARGELVLTARRFRTQEANRADARERLTDLLTQAQKLPEKRAKSRLNRVGKVRRLKAKKQRGAVKAGRGKVRLD